MQWYIYVLAALLLFLLYLRRDWFYPPSVTHLNKYLQYKEFDKALRLALDMSEKRLYANSVFVHKAIIACYAEIYEEKAALEAIEKFSALKKTTRAEELLYKCRLYDRLNDCEKVRKFGADALRDEIKDKKVRAKINNYIARAYAKELDYEKAFEYFSDAASCLGPMARREYLTSAFKCAERLMDTEKMADIAAKNRYMPLNVLNGLQAADTAIELCRESEIDLKKYARDMLRLAKDTSIKGYTYATDYREPARTQSHTGGEPFCPQALTDMNFLMQVNLSDLKVEKYAGKGILQFYVSKDLQEKPNGLIEKEFYHVRYDADENAAFPAEKTETGQYFDYPLRMVFAPIDTHIHLKDPRFPAMTEEYSGVPYKKVKPYYDHEKLFSFDEEGFFVSPTFLKRRNEEELFKKYDVCLFNFIDEGEVMLHFDIEREKLENFDFGDVILYKQNY